MTDAARLLLHVLTLAAGLAIGWTARGWWDGSTVSTADAAQSAQVAVSAAAQDTVSIVTASRQTADAAERVRIETRTITVDRGCEPGAGPVSPDRERELREVLQ